MKITELIEELEKIKNEKGDIEVCIEDDLLRDFNVLIYPKVIQMDRISYEEKHPRIKRIDKEVLVLSAGTKKMTELQIEEAKRKKNNED